MDSTDAETGDTGRWLVTVAGPDRPGIVAALTRELAAEGVDIEDVSMSRLSGNFAMMLLARGDIHAELARRLADTGREVGVMVHFDRAQEDTAPQEPNYFVSAAGPNQVGIVAAISAALAGLGANIIQMETRLLHGTMVPVYLVRIEAWYAGTRDEIGDALADVGRRIGADVRVEAIERSDL